MAASTASARGTSRLLTVSVLIATYARPAGLKAAVESLLQQSLAPDEIVIAMSSGDHATRSVLDKLTASLNPALPRPRVRVVTTVDNTVSAKENAAMAAATSDVVCFLDDDAVARPEWLARLLAHYADRAVGAVGGRDVLQHAGQAPDPGVRRLGRLRWFGRLHTNHHRLSQGVREVDFLKGCNMSFRRELLHPIDSRLLGVIPYGFEIDMGLEVRAAGHRIVYDPEAAVDHYASSDMSAARSDLAYVVNHNQTYILLKHSRLWRRVAFLFYTFVLGDRNTIGLLRLPLLMARKGLSREAAAAHIGGKLQGLRTFLAWRKANGRIAVRLTG
jgi:GT2 family glycosyltransferase